jgi:hypothetical protein
MSDGFNLKAAAGPVAAMQFAAALSEATHAAVASWVPPFNGAVTTLVSASPQLPGVLSAHGAGPNPPQLSKLQFNFTGNAGNAGTDLASASLWYSRAGAAYVQVPGAATTPVPANVAVQTSAVVDFSGTPFVIQPGDIFGCKLTLAGAPAAVISNVMVSVGAGGGS